jgi:hypothetical protein
VDSEWLDVVRKLLGDARMSTPRVALTLLAAALFNVLACGESDSFTTGDDDISRQKAVSKEEAQSLFEAVDDECAGNDNGRFKSFDPAAFDASAAMAKLREPDTDCTGQRDYSTSRESAVKLFEKHISDGSYDAKSCIDENLGAAKRKRLLKLVSDPSNLGVFASVYGGGDNPEACSYWNFHVYRADGVLVEFTFNETD